MTYNNKLSVTVGIAAYNAEHNILPLINSIINQKKSGYSLDKILVYSDASTDKTHALVRTQKNKTIILLKTKHRQGFANAIKRLFQANNSDIIILLNDDIVVIDTLFIEKTIAAFHNPSKVGMVCSNPKPLPSKSFIERAVTSGITAFDRVKASVKDGNSVLSCDGKTMSFSKSFIKSFKFPLNNSHLGNVDGYLYFSCLSNKFEYKYARAAVVHYKCPSTISDYIRWTIRNNVTRDIFLRKFGPSLVKEYDPPPITFLYYKIIEFIKNPLGSTLIFLLNIYCLMGSKLNKTHFKTTWDLVSSTKDLQRIT